MKRDELFVLLPRTKLGWGFVLLYVLVVLGVIISLLLDLSGWIVVGFLVGSLIPAMILFIAFLQRLIKELEDGDT